MIAQELSRGCVASTHVRVFKREVLPMLEFFKQRRMPLRRRSGISPWLEILEDRRVLSSLHGGTIVAWGDDTHGQVSNAPTGSDFIAIQGGGFYGLALRADGSIAAWGDDTFGQVTN